MAGLRIFFEMAWITGFVILKIQLDALKVVNLLPIIDIFLIF